MEELIMIKQVICINAEGRKNLTYDRVYTVTAIQDDGDYVVVDDSGKEIKVYASRFEDIDDNDDWNDDDEMDFDDSDEDSDDDDYKFEVICADDTNRKYITAGNTYKVYNESKDLYQIKDNRGRLIKTKKSRFVKTIPPITAPVLPRTMTIHPPVTSNDADTQAFSFNFTGTLYQLKEFIKSLKD
jgi:hypothetical protein